MNWGRVEVVVQTESLREANDMQGSDKKTEPSSSRNNSRHNLLLIFCFLSFVGSCLTVVLYVRNYSVEQQVKQLERKLLEEIAQLKATLNESQDHKKKDNPGDILSLQIYSLLHRALRSPVCPFLVDSLVTNELNRKSYTSAYYKIQTLHAYFAWGTGFSFVHFF